MIKNAKHIEGFIFEVTFFDQTTRVIDLTSFFAKNHPVIRKFAKPELVKEFYLEEGFICWGDNELEADSYAIFQGKYDAVLEYA